MDNQLRRSIIAGPRRRVQCSKSWSISCRRVAGDALLKPSRFQQSGMPVQIFRRNQVSERVCCEVVAQHGGSFSLGTIRKGAILEVRGGCHDALTKMAAGHSSEK